MTTNKPFGEWNQVFPNAACVVTLVDRLVHRSEILAIDGDKARFALPLNRYKLELLIDRTSIEASLNASKTYG